MLILQTMKWLFFILLCVLSSNCVVAQVPTQTDSLLRVLATAKADTNKALLLLTIGEQYENTAPAVATSYYNQSLQLSKQIGYTYGEIKYAAYYSSVLNVQGKVDSSLLVNLHALEKAKQFNDPMLLIKTTINVANTYNLLDQNDSTLFYYLQTLPALQKLENKRFLAIVYSNLTKIYRDIGQPEKGIDYGKLGSGYLRQMGDSVNLEYCLTNLGTNYSEVNNLDTALGCFNEAYRISQLLGDKYAGSAILLNLGDLAFQQKRFEDSRVKFEEAGRIAQELDLAETKAIALKGMAMYYLQTRNYGLARAKADSSLVITQQYNLREQRLKTYKLLTEISYVSQDLNAAWEWTKKTDQLQDSINKDNLQKVTTNYEKKYESEKKDAQINEQQIRLANRKTLNFLLLGIALALLIIVALGYRNFSHRQKWQQAKIDELETEKQLTATEAVLKGEEQERTRLAKDLHDGLGGMLSGIKFSLSNMKENLIMTPDNAQAFERSIDMLDSSIQEMRRVAHNMMPEVLVKYGLDTALKEFCNEIQRSAVISIQYLSIAMKDVEIAQTTAVNIYRIVQELVNNVIKHANARHVLVQVHASVPEKLLAVTVEDDGQGLDKTRLNEATGIGWKNIQHRVEFLKGRLDVQSSPGKGTSVLLEIGL